MNSQIRYNDIECKTKGFISKELEFFGQQGLRTIPTVIVPWKKICEVAINENAIKQLFQIISSNPDGYGEFLESYQTLWKEQFCIEKLKQLNTLTEAFQKEDTITLIAEPFLVNKEMLRVNLDCPKLKVCLSNPLNWENAIREIWIQFYSKENIKKWLMHGFVLSELKMQLLIQKSYPDNQSGTYRLKYNLNVPEAELQPHSQPKVNILESKNGENKWTQYTGLNDETANQNSLQIRNLHQLCLKRYHTPVEIHWYLINKQFYISHISIKHSQRLNLLLQLDNDKRIENWKQTQCIPTTSHKIERSIYLDTFKNLGRFIESDNQLLEYKPFFSVHDCMPEFPKKPIHFYLNLIISKKNYLLNRLLSKPKGITRGLLKLDQVYINQYRSAQFLLSKWTPQKIHHITMVKKYQEILENSINNPVENTKTLYQSLCNLMRIQHKTQYHLTIFKEILLNLFEALEIPEKQIEKIIPSKFYLGQKKINQLASFKDSFPKETMFKIFIQELEKCNSQKQGLALSKNLNPSQQKSWLHILDSFYHLRSSFLFSELSVGENPSILATFFNEYNQNHIKEQRESLLLNFKNGLSTFLGKRTLTNCLDIVETTLDMVQLLGEVNELIFTYLDSMKPYLLQIGKNFHNQSMIHSPDDIWHLDINKILNSHNFKEINYKLLVEFQKKATKQQNKPKTTKNPAKDQIQYSHPTPKLEIKNEEQTITKAPYIEPSIFEELPQKKNEKTSQPTLF